MPPPVPPELATAKVTGIVVEPPLVVSVMRPPNVPALKPDTLAVTVSR